MKKITFLFTFLLTLGSLATYAQDTCGTAVAVTEGVTNNSTITDGTAGAEMSVTNGDTAGNDSVWYTFVAPSDGIMVVSSCGGGSDTRVYIGEGTCGSLTVLGNNDDSCDLGDGNNFASEASAPVTMGNTYYIEWDDRWEDGVAFDWTVTMTVPAPNDLCSGAIPVACGMTYSGDTSAADVTVDAQGDCGSVDNDAPNLFYSYTGSGSPENVTISTCNAASYDTSLAVYTGSCGALVCYANNDDGPGCAGFTSEVTFLSDGTTTYYIMVEGFNAGSTGTFDLSVTCTPAATPPPNDTCGTAEAIVLNAAAISGDNTDATSSTVNPSCDGFGVISDVWYSFVAPASGNITVLTTIGSADQANVAVWDDCAFTTELGCSDANGGESLDVTGLTGGVTYYVQVWNDGAAAPERQEGDFTIAVNETLSAGSFEINGFEYFPNPVNDNLSLRAQNNIENVAVYNMLGQQVSRMTPNAVSSEVDMSNLSQGAYFVKVTVNGNTETIRILKK